jgi:hypothetical protein
MVIPTFYPDPVDLAVRAMCNHHLGHSKEAKACLHEVRFIATRLQSLIVGPPTGLGGRRSLMGGDPKPQMAVHEEVPMNPDHAAFLREAKALIDEPGSG